MQLTTLFFMCNVSMWSTFSMLYTILFTCTQAEDSSVLLLIIWNENWITNRNFQLVVFKYSQRNYALYFLDIRYPAQHAPKFKIKLRDCEKSEDKIFSPIIFVLFYTLVFPL